MNKKQTRLPLAFIALVLAQIACGDHVDHTVNVHVYQDLNGNGTQDGGEPDFPGVTVGNDQLLGSVITDNNGNQTVEHRNNSTCFNYSGDIRIPSGYRITENTQDPSQWDFSPIWGTANACPDIFAHDRQTRNQTVGLTLIETSSNAQPNVEAQPNANTQPTATPPSVSIMSSILGGRVSYCVPVSRNYYINLPFNTGADPALVESELVNQNLNVQIGSAAPWDVEASCNVDAVNRLMSCKFPDTVTVPTLINVLHHDQVIDIIPFSGYCPALPTNTPPPSGDDETSPTAPPTDGGG